MTVYSKHADALDNPHGAGDARPSAMQILDEENLKGAFAGFVAILTGGSSGIGIETAKALHAAGAEVVLPVRSPEKGERVVQQIKEENASISGAGSLKVMQMDLNSADSITQFVGAFKNAYKQLNILICNAGVAFVPQEKHGAGCETHFAVNHLAHFRLFCGLKDLLIQSSQPAFKSRVVMLSSDTHKLTPIRFEDLAFEKEEYQPFLAYGHSKTANLWTANEIERRYGAQGLHALAVHPGVIATDLGRHLPPGQFEEMQADLQQIIKSAGQGAATTIWAALSPELEGKGGLYCEECHIAKPAKDGTKPGTPGYSPHAYSPDGEAKLWALSEKMLAVSV